MTTLIAIAGGSGSGKTSLCQFLKKLHPSWEVVHQDDLYLDDDSFPRVGEYTNWDLPSCFDLAALRSTLLKLKAGRPAESIALDHIHRTRTKKIIPPAPVVLVEGLYPLLGELNEPYDLRIFLEADWPILLSRRLRRDPDMATYMELVGKPAYEQFVLQQKYLPGVTCINAAAAFPVVCDVALKQLSAYSLPKIKNP